MSESALNNVVSTESGLGTVVVFSGGSLWNQSGRALNNQKPKSTKVTGKVRDSARKVPDILHPLFAQLASVVEDPFWQEVFTNASYNVFPRKFKFVTGVMSYQIARTKVESLEIPTEIEPTEIVGIVQNFMKTNGGIMSELDTLEITEKISRVASEQVIPESDSWAAIKSNNQRSVLITKFVNDTMGPKYALNSEQRRGLEATINLGISAGLIGTHNIVVVSGQIVTINGLLYNSKTRRFYLDKGLKVVHKKGSRRTAKTIAVDDSFGTLGTTMTMMSDTLTFDLGIEVTIHKKWLRFLSDRTRKLERYGSPVSTPKKERSRKR
jgi:hypothetical protein